MARRSSREVCDKILTTIKYHQGILRKDIILAIGGDRSAMTRYDKMIAGKVFRQKTIGGEFKYYTPEHAKKYKMPARDALIGNKSAEELTVDSFMARAKKIDSCWRVPSTPLC